MAYKPTLADIPYSPTLNDIPKPTLGQKVANFGKQMDEAALSIPADIGTAFANDAYGLLSLIPGFIDVVPKPETVNKIVGLPEQNSADKAITDVASFIPMAVGGEAALPAKVVESAAKPFLTNMAKYGAEGGVYADSQGENPIVGAVTGAAVPGGLHLLGKFAGNTVKSIVKNAAPKVLEKITAPPIAADDIKNEALNAIKQNYHDKLGKYNALAQKALESAKALDKSAQSASVVNPYLRYNANSYQNAVNGIAKNLEDKGMSTEGLAQLKQWGKTSPDSFVSAITARKNINNINVPYGDPSRNNLIARVGDLRQALIKNAEDNAQKHIAVGNKEGQNFINKWRSANAYYSKHVAPFESLYSEKGNLKNSNQLNGAWQQDTETSPDILKHYVAKGAKNPTLNVNHLEKLIDNKQLSANALKAQVFANDFMPDGMPKTSFINKYNKLSQTMKDAMFTPSEQTTLGNIVKLWGKKKGGHNLGSLFVPAEVGGRTAEALGGRWTTGALSGLGAKLMLWSHLPELFAQESGAGLAFPEKFANFSHRNGLNRIPSAIRTVSLPAIFSNREHN